MHCLQKALFNANGDDESFYEFSSLKLYLTQC